MRASKQWENLNVWVKYPFNAVRLFQGHEAEVFCYQFIILVQNSRVLHRFDGTFAFALIIAHCVSWWKACIDEHFQQRWFIWFESVCFSTGLWHYWRLVSPNPSKDCSGTVFVGEIFAHHIVMFSLSRVFTWRECNLLYYIVFSASLLQSSVSHDPSEITRLLSMFYF